MCTTYSNQKQRWKIRKTPTNETNCKQLGCVSFGFYSSVTKPLSSRKLTASARPFFQLVGNVAENSRKKQKVHPFGSSKTKINTMMVFLALKQPTAQQPNSPTAQQPNSPTSMAASSDNPRPPMAWVGRGPHHLDDTSPCAPRWHASPHPWLLGHWNLSHVISSYEML